MVMKILTFLTKILFTLPQLFTGLFYSEITTDFKPCLRFFYKETIPQGISGDSYVALCQLYENKYRFATLYDKSRRIPLYSAYILSVADGSRPRDEPWKVQPQLASNPGNIPMEYQEVPDQNVRESQAVNEDYKNSGYDRGHLAPSGHQKTDDDRRATFTLTNIVPQKKGSNTGTWEAQEQKMLVRLKDCTSQMYVITGVLPYESKEPKINNRVHVPEYMWTAYCCESFSREADQNRFPTYAAVGRNDQNSPKDIVEKKNNVKPEHFRGYDVKEMSLESLEKILKERLKMSELSLFKDQCKSDKSKTHH